MLVLLCTFCSFTENAISCCDFLCFHLFQVYSLVRIEAFLLWLFENICEIVLALCHLSTAVYWLPFVHSVWDLSGSWYYKRLFIET